MATISEKNLVRKVKEMRFTTGEKDDITYLAEKMKYSHISEKSGKFRLELIEYETNGMCGEESIEQIKKTMNGKEKFKAKIFFENGVPQYMFYINGDSKHIQGKEEIYKTLKIHELCKGSLSTMLNALDHIPYKEINKKEKID